MSSIYHGDETMITQQKGGILKTWQIQQTGYQLNVTEDTNHKGYCRFQCVPDDDLLISPRNENEIVIYDTEITQVHHTLNAVSALEERKESPTKLGLLMCFRHVKFSSQSYVLAAYESGTFLTWDLRTNSVINVAKFDDCCPMALDFCSETNRGICGTASDKLEIVGYMRNEMKLINRGDIAIKNPGINCIKIRKDQKIFCSGGWDGRVRVFSWKSLRPLAVLTDHKAAITDIEYSNEKVDMWKSPIMATSGADGQISLWNLYNN